MIACDNCSSTEINMTRYPDGLDCTCISCNNNWLLYDNTVTFYFNHSLARLTRLSSYYTINSSILSRITRKYTNRFLFTSLLQEV